jgi:hypothetical protein
MPASRKRLVRKSNRVTRASTPAAKSRRAARTSSDGLPLGLAVTISQRRARGRVQLAPAAGGASVALIRGRVCKPFLLRVGMFAPETVDL